MIKIAFFTAFSFLALSACQNIHSLSQNEVKPVAKVEAKTVVAEKPQAEVVVEEKEIDNSNYQEFCRKLDERFKKYGWGESNCMKRKWRSVRNSVFGSPLVWEVFGNENKIGKKNVDVTLLMCGVHGDEITPIKFCFDAMDHIEELTYKEDLNKDGVIDEKVIIIAPVVNPDSFFKDRPSRTNARGVDVNRNFPTKDFRKLALKEWMNRYGKDPRRFPGKDPMSEPEVVFQINLIKRYSPSKIISVHAPLTMLDYDGPIDEHTGGILGSRANELLITMSEQAKGYRIKDYPFFPGSLGNYAGNELNIPTYTLELPSSDARKTDSYWSLFKGAIHSAIMHNLGNDVNVAMEPDQKSKNAN
ncbi:MAG: hypothetical protein Fur0010_06780 [Bdellovibrio sp.]